MLMFTRIYIMCAKGSVYNKPASRELSDIFYLTYSCNGELLFIIFHKLRVHYKVLKDSFIIRSLLNLQTYKSLTLYPGPKMK